MRQSAETVQSSVTESLGWRIAGHRLVFGFILGGLLFALVWGAGQLASPAKQDPAAAEKAELPNEAPKPVEPSTDVVETPAEAKDGWKKSSSKSLALPDASLTPLEVGGALVAVIIVMIGVAIVLRKALARTRLAPSRQRVLELVDAMPIGPKRFIYVVNLAGRTLVLGAGGEQVNLLAEYGDDEWNADDAARNEAAAIAPAPQSQTVSVPEATVEAAAQDEARSTPATTSKNRGQTSAAPGSRRLSRAVEAYLTTSASSDGDDGKTEELPGAHRVPPAFRHLLKKAMSEEAAS